MADVVLGYDSAEGYVNDRIYSGTIIGRYANRIARGRFTLDGVSFSLACNNGPNSLHGGDAGFHARLWDAEGVDGAVRLRLTSPDGAGGYPGAVHVEVTYRVDRADLRIEYVATSEAATVINLTNHAYFNLAGVDHEASSIVDHLMEIDASRYTPVDDTQIPTGVLAPVEGTPFDFRTAVSIGERIDADDPQLQYGGGYDHNYVLEGDGTLQRAARVTHEPSGRVLEVWTTLPGLQFYSGNSLDGTFIGKNGVKYGRRTAFCLETQHFPDSPNHPTFPSTVLRPGETYRHTTVYRFSSD